MSQIFTALVLFLIIAIVHQIVFVQIKKEGSRVAPFLIMAFLGLNILWILFSLSSYDFTKLYLKSTASILYLLFIPVYLTFYFKQSKKVNEPVNHVENNLQLLIKKGYVTKRGHQYFLTAPGQFLLFWIRIGKKLFRASFQG